MPLSVVSSAPSRRSFATGGGPLGPEEEVEEVLGEVLGPSPARSAVSSAVGAARTPLELLLLKIGDFLRPSPARSTVSTPLLELLLRKIGDFLRPSPAPVSSAVDAARKLPKPLELLLRKSGDFLGPSPARSAVSSAVGATRTPLELLLRSGSGGFLRKALPRASACILAAAISMSR